MNVDVITQECRQSQSDPISHMNVDVITLQIWHAINYNWRWYIPRSQYKASYRETGDETQRASFSASHRAMPKKFQEETRPILMMSALFSRAFLNRDIPVDPENLPIFTRPFFPGYFFFVPPFYCTHVQVTQ